MDQANNFDGLGPAYLMFFFLITVFLMSVIALFAALKLKRRKAAIGFVFFTLLVGCFLVYLANA